MACQSPPPGCNETHLRNENNKARVEPVQPAADWTAWMRQSLDGDEAAYRRLLAAVAERLRAQLRGRLA